MSAVPSIKEIYDSLQKDMERGRTQYMAAHEAVIRELQNDQQESLFLAIEPAENKRLIILPLRSPGAVDLRRFPSCQGTKVQKERLDKVGALIDQSYLIIRQTSSETSIFESFAANVCERLWDCGEMQVIPMVKQTLEKWQAFFRKAGEGGLSIEQRRGLYGELFVLRSLLESGCEPDIVNDWQGPLREALDFRIGSIGLEVKTTLSHRPLKVTIASEKQLSGQDVDQLFLAALPLQVSRHDGETLVEIVDSLGQAMVDWPLSQLAFHDLLIHAGYLETHSEQYRTERYRVLGPVYFRVEGEFPRIDPATLLPGVVQVQYQIILDAFASYQLAEEELIQAIQGAKENGS